MCTAIGYRARGVFAGRHLDVVQTMGETPTLMPRGFAFPYRCGKTARARFALLGVAYTPDSVPLFFDAMNEAGLYMAGLHFPSYAVYAPPCDGAVAPYELIPYVLTRCATVGEAKALLRRTVLGAIPYSAALPLTPLHWFLADERESAAVEPLADGLHVTDDTADVLTNSPPLSYHLTRLADYTACVPEQPSAVFADRRTALYSGGMGALGLPGDWSSVSRFVKACYTVDGIRRGGEEDEVSAVFGALDSVRVPKGCVRAEDGRWMHTVYTGVCDLREGVYYYRRHTAFSPRNVSFRAADVTGCSPLFV